MKRTGRACAGFAPDYMRRNAKMLGIIVTMVQARKSMHIYMPHIRMRTYMSVYMCMCM